MLTSVVDRTGEADAGDVRRTFEEVERSYADRGIRITWPVAIEVVRMPVMGATKSTNGGHTLFASLDAARSNALDGLIAHECGHMIRTETRHPSHDPTVYRKMGGSIRVPRAGLRAFGEAFNHVQDIYADDLAFLTGFEARAHEFFRVWIEGNSARRSPDRWTNVSRSVTNGFALGNLRRHGILPERDPVVDRARDFDRRAGLRAVEGFTEFFADLPAEPRVRAFLGRVRSLRNAMVRAADSRRV